MYKEAFKKKITVINDLSFSYINEGLNDFKIGDRIIHSYFRGSNVKKLFVFLSAVGINSGKPYPLFNRISWESEFEGNILCFDDPTRQEIDFAPCFYFGDAEHSCLEQIMSIIVKVAKILFIENEFIYLISSSNGGFAAIYISNLINYSTCIALCPQFDVELLLGNKIDIFCNKLMINKNDYLSRLNILNVYHNTTSKFIIYSNIRCALDKTQIDYFCSFYDIKYSIGLNKIKENFFLIVADINAVDPHIAQPNEFFCNFIKDRINDQNIHDFVNVYIQLMKAYHEIDLKYYITTKVYSALNNVKDIVISNNFDYVDVFMNDQFNSYFRIKDYRKQFIPMSFRVRNFMRFSTLEIINRYITTKELGIDYNNNIINFYSKKRIDFNQLFFWYNNILTNCFASSVSNVGG